MYDESDAAYDEYVAQHGEIDIDQCWEIMAVAAETATMSRHSETVEIRLYTHPRVITVTYPRVDAWTPGVVREVPYGPRQDGHELLLSMIREHGVKGWTESEDVA